MKTPFEKEHFYFQQAEAMWRSYQGPGARFSPLEWSYLDAWREAGIPLTAVLLGIARCHERFRAIPGNPRIKSLLYCAGEILTAAYELDPKLYWQQRRLNKLPAPSPAEAGREKGTFCSAPAHPLETPGTEPGA